MKATLRTGIEQVTHSPFDTDGVFDLSSPERVLTNNMNEASSTEIARANEADVRRATLALKAESARRKRAEERLSNLVQQLAEAKEGEAKARAEAITASQRALTAEVELQSLRAEVERYRKAAGLQASSDAK